MSKHRPNAIVGLMNADLPSDGAGSLTPAPLQPEALQPHGPGGPPSQAPAWITVLPRPKARPKSKAVTVEEADEHIKVAQTKQASKAKRLQATARFGEFIGDLGPVSLSRAKIQLTEYQLEDTVKMCDSIFRDKESTNDDRMMALRLKSQLISDKIELHKTLLKSASKEILQPDEPVHQSQSFRPGSVVVQATNAQINAKTDS